MAEVQIQKMRITHEQILNWLLLNPERSQGECAKFFNVTESWLSVIINSDVFQQRLLEKRQMMDRRVTDVLEAKARNVINKGLDRLEEIIPVATDPRLILDTTDKLLGRLGYQWIENNARFGAPDYLAYSIFVTVPIAYGFSAAVGFYGTDISQSQCGGLKVCDNRVLASISFTF